VGSTHGIDSCRRPPGWPEGNAAETATAVV
jgi:hypothetical protein